MSSLAGQTLANRYDLLALLGAGGMGEVYRAHDRELDEIVALKVIGADRTSDPAALARFRHEVKLARRVTHRNIARTFELGADRGITYCTMELVEGESLSQRLRRGRIEIGETAAIVLGLCEGLAAAHAAGVVHRDIKPGNILLASDGRAMLVDFGVAAMLASRATEISGTPSYMAPEQALGEGTSPTSDIYAVGVVLYEMLTGTRAFAGQTLEILAAKQELAALEVTDPSTPRELVELVARTTAREPIRRIQDASEVARALERWVGERTRISMRGQANGLPLHEVIVLPPEGDEASIHVALGAHQALLDRLAKVPRLRVLPRMRVDREVDAVIELRAGAAALEVRIVRSADEMVRLELVLAVEDLKRIADAIAIAIVTVLEGPRAPVEAQRAEATDLWLRGRAIIHRNISRIEAALELLERAHALAPDDPRIASTLANVHARASFYGGGDRDTLDRAAALIEIAFRHGADDADVHNAAALLELNVGEAHVAARHFRQAIACAPYSAEAHDGLGRMLIEAGFLEDGMSRLEDALAIAPDLTAATWSIARMHALEGNWRECEQTWQGVEVDSGPRPVYQLRFALWRRDLAIVAAMRQPYLEIVRPIHGEFADDIFAAILDGKWASRRDRMVAFATAPSRNRRRVAFLSQMVAEVAGLFGDRETCSLVIAHASGAGLFDLHWLDRCTALTCVRGTAAFVRSRERVERRARAILDARYGDLEGDDTVRG